MRPRFFSLRTSSLNGCVSRPNDAARSAARTPGRCRDHIQDRRGPRTVRARPVEPAQPAIELGDVVGGQPFRARELVARIRTVGGVQPDAVHGKVRIAAQCGDDLVAAPEACPSRVGVGDALRVHDVDGIDFDSARSRAVLMAGNDLTSLPAPKRQRDRAVRDAFTEPRLYEHAAGCAAPDTGVNLATVVVMSRRGFGAILVISTVTVSGAWLAAGATNHAPGAPTTLTVDDDAAPLAVERAPQFGWRVNDEDENEIQTAYEIVVRTGASVVSDTHKVTSSQQAYVEISHPALAARHELHLDGANVGSRRQRGTVRAAGTTSTPGSATTTGTRRGSAGRVPRPEPRTTSRSSARSSRSRRRRLREHACTRRPASNTSCS